MEDVPITTAQDMYDAVTSRFDGMDVLVMAAAVADYRPATVADDKIKKKDGDLSIPVERTADILGTIGPKKTKQFLCGFSMETRDMLENSSAKLTKKNLDMVVANNLKVAGAGFGVDTNVVTFITPDGSPRAAPHEQVRRRRRDPRRDPEAAEVTARQRNPADAGFLLSGCFISPSSCWLYRYRRSRG